MKYQRLLGIVEALYILSRLGVVEAPASSDKLRLVVTRKTLPMSGIGRGLNIENPITNMGVTRLVMWNRKLSLSRNRKSNSLPVNVPGHVHVGGNILKAKWQRPTLLVSVQHFVKEISVSEVV